MKIIGLSGGSGSGKGSVAEIFSEYGIPSVDTDKVYRDLTCSKTPCLDALRAEFGAEIITAGGALDRVRLREIVFTGDNADEKLKRLNEISHKFVLEKTREILKGYADAGVLAALVDAPLLFESKFNEECDEIISVIADKGIRIQRIMLRDGISDADARKRINAQLSDNFLINNSSYVIENNGDLDVWRVAASSVAKKILNIN